MADTNLTPMERLEAWVDDNRRRRRATLWFSNDEWKVSLSVIYRLSTMDGTAPTLEAAILAALAQAATKGDPK